MKSVKNGITDSFSKYVQLCVDADKIETNKTVDGGYEKRETHEWRRNTVQDHRTSSLSNGTRLENNAKRSLYITPKTDKSVWQMNTKARKYPVNRRPTLVNCSAKVHLGSTSARICIDLDISFAAF